jgi:imidazole glycerol phosphate synthase subunit HisF
VRELPVLPFVRVVELEGLKAIAAQANVPILVMPKAQTMHHGIPVGDAHQVNAAIVNGVLYMHESKIQGDANADQ